LYAWIRYKKADIVITLNGTLAGLVGVTAGCSVVEPVGALAIGGICGLVTSLIAELIEKKAKIDDVVGSFSVHGVAGVVGTLLVGVFAIDGGLLYDGGFQLMQNQAIGTFSVALWAIAVSSCIIYLLKVTIGLRVPLEHEIAGLDNSEHNIEFDNTLLEPNTRKKVVKAETESINLEIKNSKED